MTTMTYDDIIRLFYSDSFEDDVWLKIDFILSKTDEYTSEELISIYDNLDIFDDMQIY